MKTDSLFFIAIIPPQPVRGEVLGIKQIFADKYKVYHAMKSPPHITLIPPFKMNPVEEEAISAFLSGFASQQATFDIAIENFGCFKPRVIFLHPIINEQLSALYRQLNQDFFEAFPVGAPSTKPFHPHMTIAFRDLTPSIFRKAWQEYRNKTYRAQFKVDSICLLKHNGKRWDEFAKFPFQQAALPG